MGLGLSLSFEGGHHVGLMATAQAASQAEQTGARQVRAASVPGPEENYILWLELKYMKDGKDTEIMHTQQSLGMKKLHSRFENQRRCCTESKDPEA